MGLRNCGGGEWGWPGRLGKRAREAEESSRSGRSPVLTYSVCPRPPKEAECYPLMGRGPLGTFNRNMTRSVATSFKCVLSKWFFQIDIIFLYIL